MAKEDSTKIDHLKEDDIIPGQRYVCISFVSPEGIRNCSTRGLKIRGVYPTYQEAQDRAKKLQELDPNFDIFIGEVGKWLPWDPDPNSGAKEQKYQEEELQKLVEGYEKNLSRAKKLQEDRKRDMIENAAREEKSRRSKIQERLRKKLAKKKAKEQLENMQKDRLKNLLPKNLNKNDEIESKKEKLLEEKSELAKNEKNRIENNQKTINDQEKKVSSIDSQLNRIQELYNKLKSQEQSKKQT
jgi:hypothetical protein